MNHGSRHDICYKDKKHRSTGDLELLCAFLDHFAALATHQVATESKNTKNKWNLIRLSLTTDAIKEAPPTEIRKIAETTTVLAPYTPNWFFLCLVDVGLHLQHHIEN